MSDAIGGRCEGQPCQPVTLPLPKIKSTGEKKKTERKKERSPTGLIIQAGKRTNPSRIHLPLYAHKPHKTEKEEQQKPNDLELQWQPQMCRGTGRGNGVQGCSFGVGVPCLPAAGAGQDGCWGAPAEVGCGMLCSGVAGPHKMQSGQHQALPAKKQCSKNVLNPQTQTRFACRKLQGGFGKEFATRKAVAGWMLNIWGGDLQVRSGGMLSLALS